MISDLADDVRVDGAKLRYPQRWVQGMPRLRRDWVLVNHNPVLEYKSQALSCSKETDP